MDKSLAPRDHYGPIHRLENVDGNPHLVRTVCGKYQWTAKSEHILDPQRPIMCPITCLRCLEVLEERK